MGLKSPTCFYTWPFIFINASFPEDNNFVDAMGLLSPTCFSNLLVTHIQGAGLGNEGRVWLGFLKTFLTVNFLDMTISIQDSIISTKIYQRECNPYLYINPKSAHPPDMIKGVIFGSIKCYFEQNSTEEDFISIPKLFFQRLVARDWGPSIIKAIFISALNKIKTPSTTETTNESPSSTERQQPKYYYARDKL
jgi:hypothetical protein